MSEDVRGILKRLSHTQARISLKSPLCQMHDCTAGITTWAQKHLKLSVQFVANVWIRFL